MPKYICFRCNYATDHKMCIYKHLERANKCSKNIDSLKYTEDEIIKYSLTSFDEHAEIFKNKNDIPHTIERTAQEFISEMKDIYKEKRRCCNYCKKTFSKYKDLENHLLSCVLITDKSNDATKTVIDNSINNSNIYNQCNIHNYNINIELPKLVSFDDNWNIDHLDKNTKTLLFLSTLKYTKTLEYILASDLNKNVLLDKENNTGIVYNGDEKPFTKLKIEDIVDKSILKLYNHLKEFYTELTETNDLDFIIDKELIKKNLKLTEHKFNDFTSNEKIKGNVSNIISTIYNQHKTKTEQKYQSISEKVENKYEF